MRAAQRRFSPMCRRGRRPRMPTIDFTFRMRQCHGYPGASARSSLGADPGREGGVAAGLVRYRGIVAPKGDNHL